MGLKSSKPFKENWSRTPTNLNMCQSIIRLLYASISRHSERNKERGYRNTSLSQNETGSDTVRNPNTWQLERIERILFPWRLIVIVPRTKRRFCGSLVLPYLVLCQYLFPFFPIVSVFVIVHSGIHRRCSRVDLLPHALTMTCGEIRSKDLITFVHRLRILRVHKRGYISILWSVNYQIESPRRILQTDQDHPNWADQTISLIEARHTVNRTWLTRRKRFSYYRELSPSFSMIGQILSTKETLQYSRDSSRHYYEKTWIFLRHRPPREERTDDVFSVQSYVLIDCYILYAWRTRHLWKFVIQERWSSSALDIGDALSTCTRPSSFQWINTIIISFIEWFRVIRHPVPQETRQVIRSNDKLIL